MLENQVQNQQLFLMNNFGVYYLGDEEHVVVPEEINGHPVTMIGHEGFSNKTMQSITLPETLTEIGSSAFRNCKSLQSIQIPSSVERIAGGAFQGCHALTEIVLHDQISEIGSYAFDECLALEHITLPSKLEYIGAYAFSDTRLRKVDLPEGILQLANSIFFNCQQLQHVTLPSTLQVIGNCAFAGCTSLSAIELPTQVHTISEGAFEFCTKLQSVTFQSLLKIVDPTAFIDCPAISSVTAPFEQTALLEVYDEQRYIFKNDAVKLAVLPKQEIQAIDLFVSARPISWTQIEAPIMRSDELQPIDYVQQALDAIDRQDYTNALESLQQHGMQHALDSTIYELKGKLHYMLGHFEQSIIAYQKAIGEQSTEALYVHIGHALLDEATQHPSRTQYKEQIWTYSSQTEYDLLCVSVAKRALLLQS